MASKSAENFASKIPVGVFKTLEKINPSGSLQARMQVSGAIAFYWRYSIGTKSGRVLIGLYDSSAPPKALGPTARGFSVAAAKRAAEELALEHYKHRDEGGRPALLAEQRRAKAAAAEARRLAELQTLDKLLTAYCDQLQSWGRKSHKDARGIFNLHIREAWPDVAAMPAKEVSGEQFANMMRKLVKDGKGRTANKLRSFTHAAYAMALSAKTKASLPESFKDFQIEKNPIAETEPDGTQNRSAKDPLRVADLRKYWQAIKGRTDFEGAVLQLHLLTGAQRIEQLVNLKTEKIKKYSFVIYDGKGRPGTPPREHEVPLIQAARDALAICKPHGVYALSTDEGVTHVAATTLSRWAKEAAEAAEIPAFLAKRLRSGVETILAGASVLKDTRGRLQSHGVAGVQDRHYDGHEYLKEKRNALYALFAALEREGDDDLEEVPESDLPAKAKEPAGPAADGEAEGEAQEVDLGHLDSQFPAARVVA